MTEGASPGRLRAALAWMAIGGVGAATAVAVVAGNGSVGAAVAPALLAGLLFAMWTVPLRYTALCLLAALLSLDLRSDAFGLWYTPLAIFGDMFRANLDEVIPASHIKASGLELVLIVALVVTIYRKSTSERHYDPDLIPPANLFSALALLGVVAVVLGSVNGVLHGASIKSASWHARPLLHYPALFFFFLAAFPQRRDRLAIGRVVVAAALIKSVFALYVRLVVQRRVSFYMEYATNHFDSILFVVACVILLVNLAERMDRRALLNCALYLPILLGGMIANNRRLAWVALGISLLAIYWVSPVNRWKRGVTRAVLVLAPVALLYVGIGWNGSSAVFAPVRLFHSVTSGKVDRSTWDREVENWNLALSIRERPLIGRGFGLEYTEYFKGDDLSSGFPIYRSLPHNSMLGLLLFAGLFGFIGIMSFYVCGVFLAVLCFRSAERAQDRVAALCCIAAVVTCWVQAYGDLGLGSTQSKVFLALSMAVICRLSLQMPDWLRRKAPPAQGNDLPGGIALPA